MTTKANRLESQDDGFDNTDIPGQNLGIIVEIELPDQEAPTTEHRTTTNPFKREEQPKTGEYDQIPPEALLKNPGLITDYDPNAITQEINTEVLNRLLSISARS